MTPRRRHGRVQFAKAITVIALLAMLVRAFVPAGYMFASAADGQHLTVTLCSEHGSEVVVIDAKSGAIVSEGQDSKQKPKANSGAEAPCVFAAASILAAPEAPPIIVQPCSAIDHGHVRIALVAPGRGLAAPPPWATGPPLNV